MKIGNWCRKLSAALVAGGLLAPAAALAAPLNTNLLENPGFEDVDTSVTCCFDAVQINGWADGTQRGFAYNYAQGYDGGGPLAGGGSYYFTANGHGTGDDIRMPGQVAQIVDLSAGDTGAAIASGLAVYQLSAFFTGYQPDDDFASIHLEFLDSGGGSLGTALLTDEPGTGKVWQQLAISGPIPVGTASALVSPFGGGSAGGPDGYIDNVDFRVGAIPEPATVLLAGIGLAGGGLLLRRRRDDS